MLGLALNYCSSAGIPHVKSLIQGFEPVPNPNLWPRVKDNLRQDVSPGVFVEVDMYRVVLPTKTTSAFKIPNVSVLAHA